MTTDYPSGSARLPLIREAFLPCCAIGLGRYRIDNEILPVTRFDLAEPKGLACLPRVEAFQEVAELLPSRDQSKNGAAPLRCKLMPVLIEFGYQSGA
jgi:hypothetical protein